MSTTPDKNSRVEQSGASDDSIQQVHAHLQKQRPEKADGYSALPLALLGLICSVVFVASVYIVHYSIRFDPLVVSEVAKREKPSGAAGPALTRAQLGKRVFDTTCAACHQGNGQGVANQYPPLAGSEWVQGNDERIIRIVLHGLSGPLTVHGKEYNNVMAPLGGALRDEQIANVISYVRASWGNEAPEVLPETVAKVRSETAGRSSTWTAAELEGMN